jgi:hypothetical protein
LACPLTSFNKRPSDLLSAVTHRREYAFKERPAMLLVADTVLGWKEAHPGGSVLLIAGSDSWVLPFLVNNLTQITPAAGAAKTLLSVAATGNPAALLVLNRPDFRTEQFPLVELKRFADETGTALYSIESDKKDRPPELTKLNGFFADGWSQDEFEFAVRAWKETSIRLTVWNPTPIDRQLTLTSNGSRQKCHLKPNEKQRINFPLLATDRVHGEVSPPFVPSDHGNSNDHRSLGVRLELGNGAGL